MFNSFSIEQPISDFDFLKLPKDKFSLSSYPYSTNSEIHGYNIDVMTDIIGRKPNYVCRATIFGGAKEQITNFFNKYEELLRISLSKNAIGTEEALFTMVEMMYPELVNRYHMPNGDIKNYLNIIKKEQ
jgi:hypothetical protein